MKNNIIVMLAVVLLAAAVAGAQAPAPAAAPAARARLVSPEVGADGRVTFRFRAPNAQKVELSLEGRRPAAMQKGDEGVWTITTDVLEPDYYGYSFAADGVNLTDPLNPLMKVNLLFASNMVHVPGPASLAWELNDVPHGTLHHHFYKSAVVGDQRDYYVYTPPNYNAAAKQAYPVLYLLHGYSDDASGWTAVGRAHVILDNLIADGKAKPMLIVMTLGYGAPEIVAPATAGIRDPQIRERNMQKFREALVTEVMPQVEKMYRASSDRQNRAIAGLSMGGAESLYTGLNELARFAWIGAFSSGGLGEDFNAEFPGLDAQANTRLRLLWIACGTDDRLIAANRKLRAWLTSKGVKHTDVETPGAHTWMVWRRNLAVFAPMLFQGK